jgi:hypothetical protein
VEAATTPGRNSETPHNEDFTKIDHTAVRRIGILRLGWRMTSQQIRELKIQNWSKMVMNGGEWNRIAEKAKTHRVVDPTGEHGS